MTSSLVTIIILNWNGWRDTIECLESLFRIDYPNYNVIVVDNGSTDDSVGKIREWAAEKGIQEDRLVILSLKENLGFARGNNFGIKYAIEKFDPEYILILNNDTVVKLDFLPKLIEGFKISRRVALTGPKIVDYYSGRYWQGPAEKRLNLLTYLMFLTPLYRFFVRIPIHAFYLVQSKVPVKVYGIPGCCMLFKKKPLEEIGLFDEHTYLGSEEYIIAEKFMKAGYETYFIPDSVIYHKVARDTGKIPRVKKTIVMLRSEKYFLDNYLRLPNFQRLIIKVVRTLIYVLLSLWDRSYRNELPHIVKVIWKEGT